MLLCILLVMLQSESIKGFTTSTQSLPPSFEPDTLSLCNLTNPCLNGGICHDQNINDEEECSSDPGFGETVCHCLSGFTGSRCEVQLTGNRCGGTCTGNQRCILVDYANDIYKCIKDDDTSAETAPRCLPGLQHVNYTLDMKERDKNITCLEMYYTYDNSSCHDIDSSLEFEIQEEDVSNLFCLKIDYTTWETCIFINRTFNEDNFPDKPEIDVTLLAKETNGGQRSASITFRVVFNRAPTVAKKSKPYAVNIATELDPYVIDLKKDFGVVDEETLIYSLEVDDSRLDLNSADGSLRVKLKDRDVIVARVKITDTGIPKLSTTITVIIEVLNLNCAGTRDKFYVDVSGQEATPVGHIQCIKSPGFNLVYSSRPSSGNGVKIDPNGFVRATRRTSGTLTLNVDVAIEGKPELNVNIRPIEVIFGAIKTCTFTILNDDNPSKSNVVTQIKSLTNFNVTVEILLFRRGIPQTISEVYFLLIADNPDVLTVVNSAINIKVRNGSLGNLSLDRTNNQCYDKVGLAQITDDITYASDPNNRANSTKNDTKVSLTCQGFFLLPVGEVTVQWRMTSKNAPVAPLPFSRIQTTQSSPTTNEYVGTLTATNILYKDSGPFTCRLTDNAGNDDSKKLEVRVIVKPVVILVPIGPAYIESSEALTLTCKVVEPLGTDTTFTWYRGENMNKIEAASTSQYIVEGSNLESTITRYTCKGENLAGTGNQSNTLLVVVTSATRCLPEGIWPGAQVDSQVEAPCPDGMSGNQRRKCGKDGIWMAANTSQCVNGEITDVINDIQWISDGVQVGSLPSVTAKLTESTPPDSLESREIELVSKSLDALLDISRSNATLDTDEAVNFTQGFIGTASNLLDPRTADTWKDLQERPTSILDRVDRAGGLAADSLQYGEKKYIESDNIDIEVGKTNLLEQKDIEFPTISNRDDNANLNSYLLLSAVTVEGNAFTGPTSYSSVYYKNLTDQLPKGQPSTTDNTSLIVNSHTLAFNFYSNSNVILDPPMTINFTHQNNLIIDKNPVCGYLNVETNTWESEGCNATETNQFYTVCVCSHLTNFAILMNPTNQVVKHLAIQIITYVGCSISVFCLALTVIIYITVWRYVRNDQAVLIMNACVCLGVSMMLFLIGIDKTSNEIACKVIAVMLHFFYLVTFFSMLSCGLEIVWTVVQVFATRSKIKPLLVGSYILPLVIVAVSMASTSLEGYITETACWLSTENGLIYAFIGPVLLIIIVNFIIIGKLVHTLLSTRSMENKSIQTKIKKGLRGICILVPVLGVSWVIGIFAFNEETVVFQYIFAVMNSLQGLFIFITQVCLSTKVRKGLARYKDRYSSGRLSAKPEDARSPRAQNMELGPLQTRDPESSAYANLLDQPSESSAYLRACQSDEGPSNPYDLPDDQMARPGHDYSGLQGNNRVSNVYNEIGRNSEAGGYSNMQGPGGNGRSDPTYRNLGAPSRSQEDGHETNAAYNNMPRRNKAGGTRLEPLGASDPCTNSEDFPPLPRRIDPESRRDFIPYGSRSDLRTGSPISPPPITQRPR